MGRLAWESRLLGPVRGDAFKGWTGVTPYAYRKGL